MYIQLSCIYIILDYSFWQALSFKKNFILQIPCLFLKSQTERFLVASLLLYYRGKTKRSMKNVFKEIHHVAINASNYQATKNFYVEKLGFEVLRENHRPEKMILN